MSKQSESWVLINFLLMTSVIKEGLETVGGIWERPDAYLRAGP